MIITPEAEELLQDALDIYVKIKESQGQLPLDKLDLAIALGQVLIKGAEIINAKRKSNRAA